MYQGVRPSAQLVTFSGIESSRSTVTVALIAQTEPRNDLEMWTWKSSKLGFVAGESEQ